MTAAGRYRDLRDTGWSQAVTVYNQLAGLDASPIIAIADLHVPDIESAKDFYADYLGQSDEELNLGGRAKCVAAAVWGLLPCEYPGHGVRALPAARPADRRCTAR